MIIVQVKCDWETKISEVKIKGIAETSSAYEVKATLAIPRFGKLEKELCAFLRASKWISSSEGASHYHLDETIELREFLSRLSEEYTGRGIVFTDLN